MILKTSKKSKHLVILEINDTHGYSWPHEEANYEKVGGFASISTIVNEIRKESETNKWDCLFLHAGDINIGMPESDLFSAEPDILALNMMKLDAMTIGNHEFDNPVSVLLKQMKMAEFPIISANIVYKKTNEPFAKPYIIKDLSNVKVAILGLTTKTTEYTANPVNVKDIEFLSPNEVARIYVPKLREIIGNQGIIIVLGHLGIPGFEEKVCDGNEEIVKRIEEVDKAYDHYGGSASLSQSVPGIDIILDGHTHTLVTNPFKVNNSIIMQAFAYSKYLARIDLEIANGAVVNYEYKIINNFIDSAEKSPNGKIIPDIKIEKLLEPYYESSTAKLNEIVGSCSIDFINENDGTRKEDTIIGHLITDTMFWKASKIEKIHAALIDGGRIRAGISAGNIKYKDILKVLPFGDKIVILKIIGFDLLEAIKWGAIYHPKNSGARLNSNGLTYTVTPNGVKDLLINGKDMDPDAVYTIAVNDYIANGGDNYFMLKGANRYDTDYLLADSLKEYIQNISPIDSYPFTTRWVEQNKI
jgi:5'-nucleotidase/UDP-sugar diphosphatase